MTFLPSEKINQPDAIEKEFCELFHKIPKKPLKDDMAKILYIILQADKKDFDGMMKQIKPTFSYGVLESMMVTHFNFKMDEKLKSFVATLCSYPGRILMYLTYLQWVAKQNQMEEITIDFFCKEIFPFGTPDEEFEKEYWDGQKVRSLSGQTVDNLLDYSSARQSIML